MKKFLMRFFNQSEKIQIESEPTKEELLEQGIDIRETPPWEFPDPVMQTDADLRKRIAELEEEVLILQEQVNNQETWERTIQNERAEIASMRKQLKENFRKFDEKVERTVGIRTATLQDKLNKANWELRKNWELMNRKK